jgi:queuine/archaeosine tRNA-ribosyltransferase
VPIINMRHQHGKTWADYNRGCRCDLCRAFVRTYQRERRQVKKVETLAAARRETNDQEART